MEAFDGSGQGVELQVQARAILRSGVFYDESRALEDIANEVFKLIGI